jgi:hypothetical protein
VVGIAEAIVAAAEGVRVAVDADAGAAGVTAAVVAVGGMAVVMADTAAADGTRARLRIARIYTDRAIKDELKELRFRSRLFVFWDAFWFIYLSAATSRIRSIHG